MAPKGKKKNKKKNKKQEPTKAMLAQKTTEAMVRQARLVFEPVPSYSLPTCHIGEVTDLVTLEDDSFVTCSADNTAKRWMRDTTNKTIRLVGTYSGHTDAVVCVIEKDDNTLLTASSDETLKVWNTTTCECLETFPKRVSALLRTKSRSTIVYGLLSGTIEMRRLCDLALLSYFQMHSGAVLCLCELVDGSFVSGSTDKVLVNWHHESGALLRVFNEHKNSISRVIEVKKGIVASGSADKTVKLWDMSIVLDRSSIKSCIHSAAITGLEKVNDRFLVSGTHDGKMLVWDLMDDNGSWKETHQCDGRISAMTSLRGGSIVTVDANNRIEIRW